MKKDPESIKEHLQKILALAEQGYQGEADAARLLLEKLLAKYGMTMEDLAVETKKTVWFEYKQEIERTLLNQIIYKVFGSANYDAWSRTDKRKCKGFDLTPAQEIEARQLYDFHIANFRAELKTMTERLKSAYIAEHDIYPEGTPEWDETNGPKKSLDELLKIRQLMDQLDQNKKFHKALNK